MKEGNKYLPKYIEIFNKKFAVEPLNKVNMHRPILKTQKLDEILCFKETRVLTKNLAMQYKNMTYQVNVNTGYEYTMRKARVDVLEKINGDIKIEYKGRELEYSVIKITKPAKIYDSKRVNKRVDEIIRQRNFKH